MKRCKDLSDQVKLVAVQGEPRHIDFYIVLPNQKREYAFTRRYSTGSYDRFKGGMRINELLSYKSRDKAIMKVVTQANRMMPYLAEYLGLPLKAS